MDIHKGIITLENRDKIDLSKVVGWTTLIEDYEKGASGKWYPTYFYLLFENGKYRVDLGIWYYNQKNEEIIDYYNECDKMLRTVLGRE